MDRINLFIVEQLELVMFHVPSAPSTSPRTVVDRFSFHQDVALVICVTTHAVTPIVLLAGHHLYSCPTSVLGVELSMENARVRPVIWSRSVSTPIRFFRVIIACNLLCSSVYYGKLTAGPR